MYRFVISHSCDSARRRTRHAHGGRIAQTISPLDGVPVVIFTLRRLAACPAIHEFLIATRAEEVDSLAERVAQEHLGQPVRVLARRRHAARIGCERAGGGARKRGLGLWCMTRCGRW